jgi:enoyl-CoA hydratase/carnithine racemase
MKMSDESTVLVERAGEIAHVILNRPAARNALNMAMCLSLREAFEELGSDDDLRAILVSGRGPVFCAGADLKERQGRDAAWIRERRLASFRAYAAIERCPLPVVALVNGSTVGSGGEIAMSCDFIIAADDASFRFPEAHWGTVGATQRLQRVIGRARAKELLFTGRELPAAEALALGLVARMVKADALAATGMEVARQIAGAPALAMRLTKQAIDLGGRSDLDAGIGIEMAAIERVLADGGWKAGVEKFAETIGKGTTIK